MLTPIRILVADDEEDQLVIRSLLLERSGFAPIQANNCVSALSLAAAHQPQCAVVDLRLPREEHGLHLIRELKRLDPQIRIVVLTGAATGHFASQPEASLVDKVLLKPLPSALLIENLRQLFSQSYA